MVETYKVKLDSFEGPLDLLLHLINQYEIDIYDIPMAEISEQYMHYIHTMQHLELNIASEYLVMAATLLAIKSNMLLPKQELDNDIDEYEEDPREELIKRIIEYKTFKEAATTLKDKEIDANQIYTRPPYVLEQDEVQAVVKQGDVSIYTMIDALDRVFKRKKWKQPLETRVHRAEIPIEQRMEEVLDILSKAPNGTVFDNLFPYPTRSHIVVTFMAILELMKKGNIICKQEKPFEQILLFPYE
ncbi:segregation/condensation protein A [Virgibacillus soli]|uniref:segregation/condensation protein A n=1 Tax=Paracerasibacillus soli TaxID=480284 RepID=UPI0035EB18EC